MCVVYCISMPFLFLFFSTCTIDYIDVIIIYIYIYILLIQKNTTTFYSSFLLVRAIRADRRPAGVMTVPVFCSSGVPLVGVRPALRRVLGDLVGVLVGVDGDTLALSGRDEILDNPKTNKNPNSPTYNNE